MTNPSLVNESVKRGVAYGPILTLSTSYCSRNSARQLRGRGRAEFVERQAPQLRDRRGRVRDICGLIALSAQRHGRQERAVGLDQQTVERRPRRGLADRLGALEGDDAREADVEAERDVALGVAKVTGEAVDDAADLVRALFL